MAKKILITGASGLIGKRLTELLLQKGYQVSHLGRSKPEGIIPGFVWDIDKGIIDPLALKDVDAIIHLSGAGIADKRWTSSRKMELLESRTRSTALLRQALNKEKHQVTSFLSASGTGYYGAGGDEIFAEESRPGRDYIARLALAWEAEADKISSPDIRVVKLRIGIVLSEKGGALAKMALPIQLGIGSPLGSGKQFMSWIHLDDLCEMFIKAVNDPSMKGVYNAVGPEWTTNAELTKAIAKILKRPLWLPPVPGFVLKIVVGEVADLVIQGTRISSQKIQGTGFKWKFIKLDEALKDLLLKRTTSRNV